MPRPGGKPQTERILALGIDPDIIPDPGASGTFDTTRPGIIEITTAAAEARTLPDPTFRGQILFLYMVADGGDCTITASSPINQAGNTQIVMGDVGDTWLGIGKYNATDGWEWQTIISEGSSLS